MFWPGTTGTRAYCPGEQGRAVARTPTVSGCPKSCCSRRRSRPSRLITPGSWRNGQRSRRWRLLTVKKFCGPGQGLATTRVPAICTAAPRSWSSGIMQSFQKTSRRCARCQALATTPLRRSRRSRSIIPRFRSTAISSASSRGCSPSRRNCPPPSRRSSGWRHRCYLPNVPATSHRQ